MITLLLHSLPAILSIVLLLKNIKLLRQLSKNRKDMYFLTRMQVTHVARALVVFSALYIVLQFILLLSGQMTVFTSTDVLHYGNETASIAALIYLIYKFKRK